MVLAHAVSQGVGYANTVKGVAFEAADGRTNCRHSCHDRKSSAILRASACHFAKGGTSWLPPCLSFRPHVELRRNFRALHRSARQLDRHLLALGLGRRLSDRVHALARRLAWD